MALDSLDEKGRDAFNLFDRQWAVPFYYDTQVLICNTDILHIAGIEPEEIKTLADLERACAAIAAVSKKDAKTNRQFIPLTWNLYSAYWLLPFQLGFGKDRLIEDNGYVIVDDAPTKLALAYLLDLQEKGLLLANERDAMLAKFVAGKTGMMLSSSYMIPELERLGVPFAIVPFPTNQETGRAVAPLQDYKAFGIPKRSRNPVMGRRLIQYLCGIGMQQRFPSSLSKFPALPVAMDVEKEGPPYRQVLRENAERGYVVSPDIGYKIYKNVMWNMLRFILTGQLGIPEALAEAQRLITVQLEDQFAQLPEKFSTTTSKGEQVYGQGKENPVDGSSGQKDGRLAQGEDASSTNLEDDAHTDYSRSVVDWLRNLW